METDEGDTGGGLQNPNPKPTQSSGTKGKSCKGCLYFSSLQKSKSKNPTCVGFSRAIQVPGYIVGETELEASGEGRSLKDFKYGCVGYSVYLDKKDSSTDQQNKLAELPFCVGLEILLDRRPAEHATTQAHKSEDNGRALPHPQPQTYRPAHQTGEEYLNRFKRNAGLVASGVAKNLNRMCSYIKETVDDILYPYRRRPK